MIFIRIILSHQAAIHCVILILLIAGLLFDHNAYYFIAPLLLSAALTILTAVEYFIERRRYRKEIEEMMRVSEALRRLME
jgi:hypothetical protein